MRPPGKSCAAERGETILIPLVYLRATMGKYKYRANRRHMQARRRGRNFPSRGLVIGRTRRRPRERGQTRASVQRISGPVIEGSVWRSQGRMETFRHARAVGFARDDRAESSSQRVSGRPTPSWMSLIVWIRHRRPGWMTPNRAVQVDDWGVRCRLC